MSELSPDPDWELDAPCREIGPELFFGYDGETRGEACSRVPAAKKFCQNTCPVISECLLAALSEPEEFGVFGGTGPRDRRDMLSGAKPLPEWSDERHERVVRRRQEFTGADLEQGQPTDNFALSLAAKSSRRLVLVERTKTLSEEGHSISQIASMLGTTHRTVKYYRAQAREMSAA